MGKTEDTKRGKERGKSKRHLLRRKKTQQMYLAEKQAGFKFLEVADNVSFLFVSNPPPSLPKETLSQCPWNEWCEKQGRNTFRF